MSPYLMGQCSSVMSAVYLLQRAHTPGDRLRGLPGGTRSLQTRPSLLVRIPLPGLRVHETQGLQQNACSYRTGKAHGHYKDNFVKLA
ncbi:unnamed protein product [Danaus chrysippus]|uniref:(African queen) hypothetical protein n=1 Tax=Danaus chrysippus TaxID=151541 RepID=A0A8J2RIA3_9NEOP|nr:unnamed protein product [Danaus chrysippus]